MGLKSIELSHDPLTGKSKGYAFIEFHLTAHAEACQRAMDGFLVAGRSLATSSRLAPLSLSREPLLLHAVSIARLLSHGSWKSQGKRQAQARPTVWALAAPISPRNVLLLLLVTCLCVCPLASVCMRVWCPARVVWPPICVRQSSCVHTS